MDSQEKKFERTNQKRRTRTELLRAAREILESGGNPSVADVADKAGISRATAYRYFSTPDEIIREAVLDQVANTINVPPAAADADKKTIEKRLDQLVADVFSMVTDNEGVFRALLGSSAIGENSERRGGRRIVWIKEALGPLENQLSPQQYQRLVHALSLLAGIESIIVMKDICGLPAKESENVLRWAAKTLLSGALDDDANVAG